MGSGLIPVELVFKPGVQRDGTVLTGDSYAATQWARFQFREGLPRKMGGFKRLTNELSGITRGMNVWSAAGLNIVHTGWSDGLEQFTLDINGNVSGIVDRTPAAFTANANTLWQFDTMYDGTATTTVLFAAGPPNLSDISASDEVGVYYGIVSDNTALAASTSPDVSGGVFSLGPYGVSYGNDGIVNYSAVNSATGSWTSSRPAASKLVAAMQVRAGAGNGPSGLIWGIDSLLRMTFVGGSAVFNFDTISPQYSILSSQSIIEFDGIYFWVGIDKFLMFNGVIQEVENSMNANYFFDNLNYAAANKVFTTKVPRWGEIWVCYPRGSATECTHAVIWNVRLSKMLGYNVWYDTELPNTGRSCAQYARVFRSPLFTGVLVDTDTDKYKLWQHEAPMVVDEIDGPDVLAIDSYYETSTLFRALPPGGQGADNKTLYCEYVEPDFVQSGDMYAQVLGSFGNARSPEYTGPVKTFVEPASDLSADDQLIYFRENLRQMRWRFGSNVAGGDYQAGHCIAHVKPGDVRIQT